MAARTFTDSAGLTWDVFEVHRATQKAGAVSPGLENGWLAFACGERKRRLAPYPPGWGESSDAELEVLCASALQAPVPRFPLHRKLRPRIRPSTTDGDLASLDDSPASVEATVRDFGHTARARGLPVVPAMLELKTLLLERYPQAGSASRDNHLVRRWFVEAYYFERDGNGEQQP